MTALQFITLDGSVSKFSLNYYFLSLKLMIYGKTILWTFLNKHIQINPEEFGDGASQVSAFI